MKENLQVLTYIQKGQNLFNKEQAVMQKFLII